MLQFIVKYWLEAAFGAISAALLMAYRSLVKKYKDGKVEQDAIREGIQALLRDRIIQAYNHYMDKGECPIYALENVTNLYERYHALGGNGTVTTLVEKLKELPHAGDTGVGQ